MNYKLLTLTYSFSAVSNPVRRDGVKLLLLPVLLFVAQCSFAQNNNQYLKLSYAEIDSMSFVFYQKGDFGKAIPLFEAGREKAKNEFGEQDSVFAEYTSNLGFFHEQLGQYDLALPLYIQTIEIRKKILGKEHPSFAETLNNLAALHFGMGNFNLALPLYIQAKDIFEKALGKEHPNFTISLNSLAVLYQNMGNFDLALPLCIQAKDIREKVFGKEHPYFANSLNNLATLHQNMGNFDLALPLYTQCINIEEKTLGKDHPSFATSLHNLAGLHQKMGNFDMALTLYTQAKDIREKALGKDHPDFAKSLNNLALLHQNMENYDLALPLYIQAKNIREKALGKDHPDVAQSLNNLAVLYQNMEKFDLALPLYIQAKDIREKALGKDHPDVAQSLNNLAYLYKRMGNFDLAWSLLGQAMNCSSGLQLNHNWSRSWMDSLLNASFASNQHLEKMIISLKFAYSFLEEDNSIQDAITKQITVSDLAIALLSKQRNQVSNEKDKLRMLALSNDWLQNNLKVLNTKEHSHKAFNISDQNKSVLLLQATKSEAAYYLGEVPDSLVLKDKKLLKKQSQLQAKLLENRSKEEQSQLLNDLNQVNQDIEAFVEMIKKEYPKYHQLKYQQVNAKVEEIQALLDDHTALLEYVISDSTVHIFGVTKQKVLWKKSSVSNKKLKENIKNLHQSLSDYKLIAEDKSYKNYTEKAYWFYQQLLAPVLMDRIITEGNLHIQNLIIVSDGELGHLPFEAFLVEQAPQTVTNYKKLHYLINDYNISYNYSATLWKENKESSTPKNNGQILAMTANYDMKLDSSMIGVRLPTDQWLRATLESLPAARKEVELLQENYEGFFVFDKLASEKTVKEKASEYAVLHFAMHGILDEKRPVLSSLAFTEDNDSTESNFWQAHEISKIKLNANLVVLSACETGYGRFETGNGIASLARAFMYAGTSALVVSLWQVNDFSTAEIMKNFYKNLSAGMPKDAALRQAKLDYIKIAQGITAHPAFWSPFIQIGNTDAIYLQKKASGYLWWGIGISIIALLTVGFWWKRAKKQEPL